MTTTHTTYNIHKEDIIERELEKLDELADNFQYQVESELSKIRKKKVKLWIKQPDKYRLLVLRTWCMKYHCSLKYILERVLPFWEQFIQRHSRKMKREGLNVRVSTLTGKRSESVLQEFLKKDFSNNQLNQIWNSNEKERLFSLSNKPKDSSDGISDGIPVKKSKPYVPKTIKGYITTYRNRVKLEHKRRERVTEEFLLRPYRNNPFTENV